LCGLQYTCLDTSTEGFLHANDLVRVAYNEFKQQFGQHDRILVAVHTDYLFTADNLKKLESLHNALANQVPYLAAVDSLITSRVTTGDAESFIVNELFYPWATKSAQYTQLKSVALSNPLLTNLLVNDQGSCTNIMLQMQAYDHAVTDEVISIEDLLDLDNRAASEHVLKIPLSDAQKAQIIDAVAKVVADYESQEFTIYVAMVLITIFFGNHV
jgi:predicted RND superfamily exporter protein